MDVQTLMHNLKEEVTCSVCMQLYTDPKQLPCLHTFCLQCLNNVARSSKRNGTIRCPLCQREVTVPDCGTMESLPDCFYLKNLLDILAIKKCSTSKATCGNCGEKNEEVSYCFHCGEFWCSVCLSGHNIIRANKDHRVLSLKDFKEKDFEDVLKRPAFCSKELHEKQVLKFFCKMCHVPVCQSCVTVDHVGHTVEHLEKTAKAAKENIVLKLESAKSAVNTYSVTVEDLTKEMLKIENSTKMTTEKIRQTTQSFIVKLQYFEQYLTDQVEFEGKKALEHLSDKRKAFEAELTKHKETISQVEPLIDRSSVPEIVQLQSHISNSLQELKDELTPDFSPMNFSFDFIPNHSCLQSIDNLGFKTLGTLKFSQTEARKCTVTGKHDAKVGEETEIELVTRNSSGEQCYSPCDKISAWFSPASDGFMPELCWGIENKLNGKYVISFFCNLPGQVHASFFVNEEKIRQAFVLTLRAPHYISGETVYSDLHNPWGVAVSTSDEIFVSDLMNGQVNVLSGKGEFLRSFGFDQLHSPCGICIDTSGRLYVVDRSNNRILLYNSQGKLIKEVRDKSRECGHAQLEEPRGICLDPEGNIIICNSGKSCVQLISPEGDPLLTFDGGACGLQFPFGCIYHDGRVFVSDFKSHSIKVFDGTGKFLYDFGEQGSGNGQFQKPAGLAVDKAGHLLVCDDYNHRVQVFTTLGRFVSKFGCYGEERGQMNNPCGVAILKNGDIVVAEFENNHLQFFKER